MLYTRHKHGLIFFIKFSEIVFAVPLETLWELNCKICTLGITYVNTVKPTSIEQQNGHTDNLD